MSDEKLDGLFMTAIQQSQGIDNFFNNLFSFMRRKTDFFTLADKSKTIVDSALDEHLKLYHEAKDREAKLKAKQEQERKQREAEQAAQAAKRVQGESEAQVQEVTDEEADRIMQDEAKKKEVRESSSESPVQEDEAEENKEGEEKKDKGAKPNAGNGGETDKYRWTQTLEEVTVYVPLPDGITSKQLDVQMKSTTLKIGLKGQAPIIDGPLHKKIKASDSLWTLETDGPKRTLQLTFVKVDGMNWWNCVIEGDTKIDT